METNLDLNATAKGQRLGYVRVSTLDQNTTRQLDGVELDRTFVDRASGGTTDRPGLADLRRYAREGDSVFVHSMDRLARNVDDLRKLVTELNGRGVRVAFVKENLVFTGEDSPMANLLLSMLGAVAQFERDLIRERQREGIALAKGRGVYKGSKFRLTTEQARSVRARLDGGESPTELGREFGLSRVSIYRYAKRDSNNLGE